jgi:hypothetical protein
MLVLNDTPKNAAKAYILFCDDDLFKLVALCKRYEHRSPLDLRVPECYPANKFLAVGRQLAGRKLTKVGHKSFIILTTTWA